MHVSVPEFSADKTQSTSAVSGEAAVGQLPFHYYGSPEISPTVRQVREGRSFAGTYKSLIQCGLHKAEARTGKGWGSGQGPRQAQQGCLGAKPVRRRSLPGERDMVGMKTGSGLGNMLLVRVWPWSWFKAPETEGGVAEASKGRARRNPHSILAPPHSPHSLAGTPGFHRYTGSRKAGASCFWFLGTSWGLKTPLTGREGATLPAEPGLAPFHLPHPLTSFLSLPFWP